MNKKALVVGLVYSLIAIAFKLVILLGGYTFTHFGFYYSHFMTVVLLIPFFIIAVYLVREKDFGGYISGRDAMRISLTVFAVGVLIMSVYNYIEFSMSTEKWVSYYKSDSFLQVLKDMQLKAPDKVKTEKFPQYINEQINSLSAMKATTAKLFSYMLLGLGGAFIVSLFMKRAPKVV